MPLFSAYPQLGNPVVRADLHRLVLPRLPKSGMPNGVSDEDPLVVMWSSTRHDMRREHWVPNHFMSGVPRAPNMVDIPPDTITQQVPLDMTPQQVPHDTNPEQLHPDTIPDQLSPDTIPDQLPPNTEVPPPQECLGQWLSRSAHVMSTALFLYWPHVAHVMCYCPLSLLTSCRPCDVLLHSFSAGLMSPM
ncbi:hypothetical protein ACOMHN_059868 [Nucella lapillus]